MQSEFPRTVSCNRLVVLQQNSGMPMELFLQLCGLGQCTGVSVIDSTPIRVCHIRRESSHKTFRGLAARGQCSMGWFFGFKLHIVINGRSEILDFLFTQAHVDEREPLKNKNFHDKIFGKHIADNGYISKNLFEELFIDGINRITKVRKNMKNSLIYNHDKLSLRKRAIIETVNDHIKNI